MDGDHDSEAIYFSTTVVTPRIGERDLTVVKLAATESLDLAVPTCIHGDRPPAFFAHSSRMSARACALYLTLHTADLIRSRNRDVGATVLFRAASTRHA